jgi:hypothetical protein
MSDLKLSLTRRDFLRGATCATVAATMGIPTLRAQQKETAGPTSRAVLVRDQNIFDKNGKLDPAVVRKMLDTAMVAYFGAEDAAAAWKQVVKPDDLVGIKTNVWGPLPTPTEFEQALKTSMLNAGVPEENIDISDRGVLSGSVFKRATALINIRPLRTHHWSGVGGLIKNYITFVVDKQAYHPDSCADLAKLWELPQIKGKTRLNILLMLTPLFHGIGPHHFDSEFTWNYNGILLGEDPVALDATGVRILEAKRKEHFGEERPIKPSAHHVAFAEVRHKLGVADPERIDLVKLGWQEGSLI